MTKRNFARSESNVSITSKPRVKLASDAQTDAIKSNFPVIVSDGS